MIKKGFRKKVLAGMLAVVTVLGTALELPMTQQSMRRMWGFPKKRIPALRRRGTWYLGRLWQGRSRMVAMSST